MQSFKMGAMAAMAVFATGISVPGAAVAQPAPFKGSATLANPASAPWDAVIAGVAWRCEGAACVGAAARRANLDGLVRECRKVVAVIGPVSAYRSGGRDLTRGQLRACNRSAVGVQAAHN